MKLRKAEWNMRTADRFSAMSVMVPKALGATLMATVVLRQLRATFPGRTIRCVVQYPELLISLPYIDEVVYTPIRSYSPKQFTITR